MAAADPLMMMMTMMAVVVVVAEINDGNVSWKIQLNLDFPLLPSPTQSSVHSHS